MTPKDGGSFLLSATVGAGDADNERQEGTSGDGHGAVQGTLAKLAEDAVRTTTPVTILLPEDEFAARLAAWLASVAMNTEGAT